MVLHLDPFFAMMMNTVLYLEPFLTMIRKCVESHPMQLFRRSNLELQDAILCIC